MKIICSSLDFSEAVSKVTKALPLKKVNPILEGIKLVAKDDTLVLYATDTEIAIEKKIIADVKIEGEVLVSGRLLGDFSKTIPEGSVELDATGREGMTINYGNGIVTVPYMNVDEYPSLKEVGAATEFVINKQKFKNVINKVIFNVAQEDSRPSLKGVCLDLTLNKVTAVASNGFRLALANAPVKYDGDRKIIIVPARSISEISRLVDDDDSDLKIWVEDNFLKIDLFHTKIVTRLIDGDYLNYRKIIPTEFTTKVICPKQAFEASVNRASYFNRYDKKNIVRFEIMENNINVRAEDEGGGLVEDVAVKTEGKDLLIGFNSKYIMESLKAIDDEFIKMEFTTSTAAGIISPATVEEGKPEDEEYLYLILPIRITAG